MTQPRFWGGARHGNIDYFVAGGAKAEPHPEQRLTYAGESVM